MQADSPTLGPALILSQDYPKGWYCAKVRRLEPSFDCAHWTRSLVAVERDGLKVVFDPRGRGATYDLRRDPREEYP